MVLQKHKANHSVATRKQWKKFGAAAKTGDSFKDGTTTLCEAIQMKLAVGSVEGEAINAQTAKKEVEPAKKVVNTTIKCRHCNGDHWTTKCPYKDTLGSIGKLMGNESSSGAGNAPVTSSGASDAGSASGKPTGSRYVPPSLRSSGASGPGAAPGSERPSFRRMNDDLPCIRVSSLSEDTTEADIQRLFGRFGPVTRIFLATDRETRRCKGFAFITYRMREHAQKAIDTMDKVGFHNLLLQVEWSKRD
jgi:translation initiation factor 3 subunit G